MPLKIAMIGAGSVGFTRRLMMDLLTVPEFADTRFALMDISARNLEMVAQLCERDIRANGLPATISSTLDRREAIADADYIICMIRQGGLDAFALDIDIPLKYGVDQCVGDTICAGGIMYGQRTIPALLGICQRHPRCRQAGGAFPQLLQSDGNEYLGVQQIWRCADHWSLSRHSARSRTDRRVH